MARLGSITYSSSDALFRIIKDGEIEIDAEVAYRAKRLPQLSSIKETVLLCFGL
jgi:hypothetical protein